METRKWGLKSIPGGGFPFHSLRGGPVARGDVSGARGGASVAGGASGARARERIPRIWPEKGSLLSGSLTDAQMRQKPSATAHLLL